MINLENKKSFRIISLDPARTNDGFAIVGVDFENGIIKIGFVTQFTNQRFGIVARYIKELCSKRNPDLLLLEKNGLGKGVEKLFREKYGIVTIPVYTVGKIVHSPTINSMDKNSTIVWLAEMFDDHRILFPEKMSISMHELFKQVKSIKGNNTLVGNISYKAERGRHDDLFSSLLLCAHAVRVILYEKEASQLK